MTVTVTVDEAEPPRQSPVPAERWATRELRLALVCYGGVSLAIYMHGVTKEIHKLVLASAALEADQAANPFPHDTTEHVYWDLLSRISAGEVGGHARGASIRVVVDVIAGTSAGGINGVFLAKALSRNLNQDGLRRLWFEKGDIKVLLVGPRWMPWAAKVLSMGAGSAARRRLTSPLRGDAMCKWVHEALDGMNGATVLRGADSLLPEDHTLDLFVPITDFYGYEREIPLYDPRFVRDRTYRHVMHFRHTQTADATASQFSPDYDHVLAFAARATSSFPGAFPPVSFHDYADALGVEVGGAFKPAPFFPLYALAHADPEGTHFIDGGVLDNFPFGPAIEAIAEKPAATEVDRRLVYIEPDPGAGGDTHPDGKVPGVVKTVLGGYASIPRQEPILDDLLNLARRNEAVLRVRDVIEASFPSIKDRVAELVQSQAAAAVKKDTAGADLIATRQAVEQLAVDESGFSAATYLRVRIRSVVEGFADAVAQVLLFPSSSYQAAFVAAALRAWAVRDKLLEQQPDAKVTAAQVEFLSDFDLQYHQRRVRFLIAALSWLYPDAGTNGIPTRRQLDVAKATLYAHVFSLDSIVADLAANADIEAALHGIFTEEAIRGANLEDEFALGPFVEARLADLEAVRRRIRDRIAAALARFEEGLQKDLLAFMGQCGQWLRDDLTTRYVGFPFWDVLVYPLQVMSGVGERDHVEVYRMSPRDVSLLGPKDLKGASLAHFGAFFSRPGRESDYLWGRLDAAERLVKLLLDVRGHPPTLASAGAPSTAAPIVAADELARECVPAFRAILAEDGPALTHAQDRVDDMRARVEALAANGPPTTGGAGGSTTPP